MSVLLNAAENKWKACMIVGGCAVAGISAYTFYSYYQNKRRMIDEGFEDISDYKADDVFNADETGLFFQYLPNKTAAFRGEECHGGKQSKLRVTVLLAANQSGKENLPPL
ncbi:hypothetical protein AVEN_247130-1 [Araneus ventricosus]|uniref:DDE-1 domain-containing protein n=1 Tax=Araneus ventricosus TaxID=182803 RepID=A0A4Y2FS00_ARAVE|nr:hypothetical protein AVEN_247130-1 [Araneus ventricosus]